MNIVLTQKDADSIINHLRKELEDMNDYQKDAATHFNELLNQYNDSEFLQQTEECKVMFEETRELFDKRMNEICNERSKLFRFIELLTCGSEVENAAS